MLIFFGASGHTKLGCKNHEFVYTKLSLLSNITKFSVCQCLTFICLLYLQQQVKLYQYQFLRFSNDFSMHRRKDKDQFKTMKGYNSKEPTPNFGVIFDLCHPCYKLVTFVHSLHKKLNFFFRMVQLYTCPWVVVTYQNFEYRLGWGWGWGWLERVGEPKCEFNDRVQILRDQRGLWVLLAI